MSSAEATLDVSALPAEAQNDDKRKKSAEADLTALLQYARDSVKRIGAAAGNFFAWLISVIKSFCVRVAQLCGAEVSFSDEKGGEGDSQSQQLTASFTGSRAPQAAQVAKEVADLQLENLVAIAPALDRLKSESGADFLAQALRSLDERLLDLKREHTEVQEVNEPLLKAVCDRLAVDTYKEAYDLLTADGVQLDGPPVDPNGEFRVLRDRLVSIEDEIKKVNHAIRAYCVSALEIDELRTISEQFLAQPHMAEIKKTIISNQLPEKIGVFTQESIAQGMESRNNLNNSANVVNLTEEALSRRGARELPGAASPGVPASEKAPLGVSRFAGVNKLRVGDFSEGPSAPAEASDRSQFDHAKE